MKTVEVTYYTNQTPLSILDGKISNFITPQTMKKIAAVHNIEAAHLLYVNNHQAKFEYKRNKTVGVTDYTNQVPSKYFGWIKLSKINAPITLPKMREWAKYKVHIIFACVNNHDVKLKYKGMKLFELQITQTMQFKRVVVTENVKA